MIYFVHQGVLHWFEFTGQDILLGNYSCEAKHRNSKHCLKGIAVGNECVVKKKGGFSFPLHSYSVEYPQGHLGSHIVSRSTILKLNFAEHV